MTSRAREAERYTASSQAEQERREMQCRHVWRYPQVGGPPRRVCRVCKRVEWLTATDRGE